jgi:hypothetical protein
MRGFLILPLLGLLLLASTFSMAGQEQRLRMRPADRLMMELFTDYWQKVPYGMDLRLVNRGLAISMMQDMPLGLSRFSLAGGLAFYSHNLYADHLYQKANGTFYFQPIRQEYRKSKLSLNYLGVPVEIRFRGRDRGKGLRLFAGFSADYLVNAHTKFHGMDQAGSREIRIKEHSLEQISPFRLQAFARIGIGKWSLVSRFTLTEIFQDNPAREMVPVSLGISLSLY